MSNEIKRYEFEGRALEFAPRSEGRVGAPLKQVAEFYGVAPSVVQDIYRKAATTEFKASETWTETVGSHRNDSGVTAKAHTERFFDPPGAMRVGIMIRKSERAVKGRDFILYTIIPEWIESKRAPKPDHTAEAIRLLGNALSDKAKVVDVADKLGSLASQMFAEIKRMNGAEREAKAIDNAHGDLFTGVGPLTPNENAILAALATDGPFDAIKPLAKHCRLTIKAATYSVVELVKRNLVTRDMGKIALKPRGADGQLRVIPGGAS